MTLLGVVDPWGFPLEPGVKVACLALRELGVHHYAERIERDLRDVRSPVESLRAARRAAEDAQAVLAIARCNRLSDQAEELARLIGILLTRYAPRTEVARAG